MRIQHNIMAMNAYRNFSSNTSALSKNLEKLSSGYKINRAGDDAAGLAISEKMRAQITGLETAQKNSKDGISLIQTAEGALTEVHDMLNRMVELADQSANGTYDNNVDRANLQKEFDALRGEIDRISQSTNFNGINLLDGTQMADKIETALGGVMASGNADGTMPSEAVKAQISVMLDNLNNTKATTPSKVTDGTAPTPAKNTSVTLQLGGLDKVDVSTTASKTAAEKASFEIDFNGATLNTVTTGDKVSIQIGTDPNKLEGAVLGAAPDGTAVAQSFDGLVWTDEKGNKFDVTVNGDKVKFTAQEAFDTTYKTGNTGAGGTGVTITADNGHAFTTPTDTLVAGATLVNGNYDQYDLSAFADGDKITIGGTTYEKKGTTGYNGDKNTFGDIAGLKTMLGKRGITVNDTDGDGKKVTFSPEEKKVTLNTKDIFLNKTTVEELGKMEADTGVAMSDLFDLKINGEVVDWASTDKLKGGDKIELVSKTPGALTAGVMTNLNGISGTGVSSLSVVAGQEEGAGGAASKAEYELTFDFDKIEDGMTFKIGAKTYELSTDGVATGTNELIDLKNLDLTTQDGKKDAADAIRAKLNAATDLGGGANKFAVSTVPAVISGNTFTVTLTADTADDDVAHNLGPVQVSEATVASGGITSTYTPGRDAVVASAADKYAKAEYALEFSSLKVGDKLTVGDTTLEIVDGVTNVKDLANGKVTLADLGGNGAKLGEVLQGAGYNGASIAYDGSKLTITGTEAGGSGLDLVNGAGKLVHSPKVETSALASDADLNIQTGSTTYADILNAKIGDKDTKVSDIFDITVNGHAIDVTNETKVFQAGDKIEFTAKIAGQQADDIMDSFKFTSGATVDKANGADEGQGGGATKTQYELNFDISKLAAGQTFSIGDKTFEVSLNDKASKEGNVVIDIGGLNPGDADGQLKIAQAIQKAVDDTMGTDFASEAPDAVTDGKYTLSLTARSDGEASNLGAVRVSEAATAAITGKYTAANDATTSEMGTFAQVSYEFDASKLAVGDKITIGDTSIEITDGESGAGKLSLEDAKDAEKIINAFEANGYQSGKIAIADGKITVTGTKVGQTAKDLVDGNGKLSLTSDTRDLDAKVGGLTLQIGDTSDDFNQLTVSINKMDCASLGIDSGKININDQDAAADSVAVIKSAINSVSSTRGDLGALQNRLEHTINNLSVMTENIQDAESTIRDVDVAQEMMDYTKNNILIQSAQAMLAQANQVPQGVLQLLQ